jgi:folate-binding protein YgfZ
MHSDLSTVSLDALGVLRARGPDTVSFLQGQLSNDLALLSPQRSLLTGYHNPQGRVIAVLRLLQLAPDDLLAVLPAELVATVAARLSRFILRAKVRLTDESQQWRIRGLLAPGERGTDAALPAAENEAARIGGACVVRLAHTPARWLLVSPAAEEPLPGSVPAADPLAWQRLAVAAGEPQVYAATSEEFIAQMLNLDCLDAIAFDKGCYTGQEIIARAHYRGRVKRRMQRFVTARAQPLAPADAGTLTDGRAFRVVDVAALADGRCEFLAVTQLRAGEVAEEPGVAAQAGTAALAAEQLALPYVLPE